MKGEKIMKKFLSLALCIIMILSVAITTVSATDGTDGTTDTTTQKVWTPDAEWIADFNAATDKTVFEIGTPEELYALLSVTLKDGAEDAATSRAATAGKTFVLTANLDLEGAEWPGILDFSGNFDGQGHTISNFTQTNTYTGTSRNKNTGFFRNVSHTADASTLEIKNLVLKDATIKLDTTKSTQHAVGGLVGAYSTAAGTNPSLTISNVLLDVDVILENSGATGKGETTTDRVAGFVGAHTINSTLIFNNCVFTGTVQSKVAVKSLVGGFVGDNQKESYTPKMSYNNCMSLGELSTAADGAIRVWTARTAAASKNTSASGISHFVVESETAMATTAAVAYRDLTANPFTLEDVGEDYRDNWYKDEVYGIIPKGLADNVLYKTYAQKTTAPDANGKYKVRVLGVLQSIDLQNVKLDVQVSADNGATWTAVPVGTVTTVYTSVMAAGSKVTAEDLGGKYVYGAVLTGIPAGKSVTVKVTPTKTMLDGTEVIMATEEFTLTFPAAE